MRGAFALENDTAVWVSPQEAEALASVPAGRRSPPPVLFAKITEEDLELYRARFGGAEQ